MFVGIAVILIGLIFLAQNMGWISGNTWQIIWPILVILVGLSMICKHRGMCCCGHEEKK